MGEIIKLFKYIFPFVLSFTFSFCQQSKTPGESEDQSEKTLSSIKKINDHPLYEMTFYGEYGFDNFLKTGIVTKNDNSIETDKWGCTCFAALNDENNCIMARNFDWHDNPALILFTDPPNGYASVSMVDIYYLGLGHNEYTKEEKLKMLDAPFYPFDGMNEKGVTIGMMAVPYADIEADPNKITLDCLHIIRLVLDYAATVDEAVSLINKYNISFEGGPPLHYFITDISGNSVIIEFVNNEIVILQNSNYWQVSTNFIISTQNFEQSFSPCWRYNEVYEKLSEYNGRISDNYAMEILESVSQSNTQWSVVYNISSGKIFLSTDKNYNTSYIYNLY